MHNIKIKSKLNKYEVKFLSIDEIKNSTKNELYIVDKNVYFNYEYLFKDNDLILIDCIEKNKTLDGVMLLLNKFTNKKLKKNSTVVAFGGGILQDIVGFACSIYCRGIDYILIPTTLLSQCDSCIGGKTSINFYNIKNILGTFYPPKLILISTEFLKTLIKEDYYSGFGEILKFGILQNKLEIYDKLIKKNKIKNLINDSLRFKKNIIEIDEFDKKERKFLNFGHTFGHALEIISEYKIPHGTAVLFGILIANEISFKKNIIDETYKNHIFEIIYNFIKHQSIKKEWFDFNNLIEIVKLDKKNDGSINMILIYKKTPKIYKIDDMNELKSAISNIYESIRLRNNIS